MENFLNTQLNRAIWIAMLDEENILDGIQGFENYMYILQELADKPDLASLVDKEIKLSIEVYKEKLDMIANNKIKKNEYSSALICLLKYLRYDQTNVNILKNAICCMDKTNQFDLSNQLIEKLENLANYDIQAYKNLGSIYDEKDNIEKAVEYYEKFFAKKDYNLTADDYNLWGCLYNKMYHQKADIFYLEKGLEYFKNALSMEECNPLYLKNNIITATLLNDFTLATSLWKKFIANYQISNSDKFDYAAHCLQTKNYEDWYKYYDSRFFREIDPTIFPENLNINEKWDGIQKLNHSTLLVYFEQGFGDTFLVSGYIPRLVKMAKKVIFVVQDLTKDLIASSNLGAEVLAECEVNWDTLKFDYFIPSMSIPSTLKLNHSNLSVGGGYLKPNKNLIEEYKNKYFNNDKFKIGICFSGNQQGGDKTRDIDLKYFLPLENFENIELYSLSKNATDKNLEFFQKHKIHNEIQDFTNFEQTAAYMENLDIIITSDNCILNLAGGLGKKTYALFNWHYQFRWYDLSGDNVGWFTSVKPFINDKINNWTYSMDKVISEIKTTYNLS